MGANIKLTAADGFTFEAYRAEPEVAPQAALVLIQEIFGVNKHIREVADGYAEDGYLVIAPQIFDRVEPNVQMGYEEADMQRGMALAFEKLKREDAFKDIQAAIDAASEVGKVGVVGYCFGGLMTWLSACELKGLSAAVAYYPGGIAGELSRKPRCPVLMHFGEKDSFIPLSDVEKVRAAHPDVTTYVYPADHGFNCDHRASYDGDAAALARGRTLKFFAEQLVTLSS